MSCSLVFSLALSAHINLVNNYNEVHPAVKCDRDDSGLIAGAFLNSERRLSSYAGFKLSSPKENQHLWIEVGLVTGYTSQDILPYARLGYDVTQNVSLFLAPALEVKADEDSYRAGIVAGVEILFSKSHP